jgi:branched-chain amino acid transport system ATP-binding protein
MNVLEVRNATKRFGSLVAVQDVSLSVPKGELRAIIGPNGAGKTTFFNLISGFQQNDIHSRVEEVLKLAGLETKADRLVGELAHGDQRAAEIAMALTLNPHLLLLDEPTAGMGDRETFEITKLIRRLHRDSKLTIVLIEHDMRVVFHLADRITVLDQGKLLAEGTPQEIAANAAVQAAYLGKAA